MLIVNETLSHRAHDPLASNLIIQGDNVPVMKSLCESPFDFLGKVDLMLWDPPYNTGNKDFMYNDRFGSHESWLLFM